MFPRCLPTWTSSTLWCILGKCIYSKGVLLHCVFLCILWFYFFVLLSLSPFVHHEAFSDCSSSHRKVVFGVCHIAVLLAELWRSTLSPRSAQDDFVLPRIPVLSFVFPFSFFWHLQIVKDVLASIESVRNTDILRWYSVWCNRIDAGFTGAAVDLQWYKWGIICIEEYGCMNCLSFMSICETSLYMHRMPAGIMWDSICFTKV